MLVCVRFCVVRAIYYLRKTDICSSFRKKVVKYLLQNSGGCVILIEGARWKWLWLLCFGCLPSLFWMTCSHSGLMLSSRKRSSQRPLLLSYPSILCPHIILPSPLPSHRSTMAARHLGKWLAAVYWSMPLAKCGSGCCKWHRAFWATGWRPKMRCRMLSAVCGRAATIYATTGRRPPSSPPRHATSALTSSANAHRRSTLRIAPKHSGAANRPNGNGRSGKRKRNSDGKKCKG